MLDKESDQVNKKYIKKNNGRFNTKYPLIVSTRKTPSQHFHDFVPLNATAQLSSGKNVIYIKQSKIFIHSSGNEFFSIKLPKSEAQ